MRWGGAGKAGKPEEEQWGRGTTGGVGTVGEGAVGGGAVGEEQEGGEAVGKSKCSLPQDVLL